MYNDLNLTEEEIKAMNAVNEDDSIEVNNKYTRRVNYII